METPRLGLIKPTLIWDVLLKEFVLLGGRDAENSP